MTQTEPHPRPEHLNLLETVSPSGFVRLATDDLYITWSTGIRNELTGPLAGYFAEIPEVWGFSKC